jgi:hypothetical protein
MKPCCVRHLVCCAPGLVSFALPDGTCVVVICCLCGFGGSRWCAITVSSRFRAAFVLRTGVVMGRRSCGFLRIMPILRSYHGGVSTSRLFHPHPIG